MVRRLLRVWDRNRKTTRLVSGGAGWCNVRGVEGHQPQVTGGNFTYGWVGNILQGLGEASKSFRVGSFLGSNSSFLGTF